MEHPERIQEHGAEHQRSNGHGDEQQQGQNIPQDTSQGLGGAGTADSESSDSELSSHESCEFDQEEEDGDGAEFKSAKVHHPGVNAAVQALPQTPEQHVSGGHHFESSTTTYARAMPSRYLPRSVETIQSFTSPGISMQPTPPAVSALTTSIPASHADGRYSSSRSSVAILDLDHPSTHSGVLVPPSRRYMDNRTTFTGIQATQVSVHFEPLSPSYVDPEGPTLPDGQTLQQFLRLINKTSGSDAIQLIEQLAAWYQRYDEGVDRAAYLIWQSVQQQLPAWTAFDRHVRDKNSTTEPESFMSDFREKLKERHDKVRAREKRIVKEIRKLTHGPQLRDGTRSGPWCTQEFFDYVLAPFIDTSRGRTSVEKLNEFRTKDSTLTPLEVLRRCQRRMIIRVARQREEGGRPTAPHILSGDITAVLAKPDDSMELRETEKQYARTQLQLRIDIHDVYWKFGVPSPHARSAMANDGKPRIQEASPLALQPSNSVSRPSNSVLQPSPPGKSSSRLQGAESPLMAVKGRTITHGDRTTLMPVTETQEIPDKARDHAISSKSDGDDHDDEHVDVTATHAQSTTHPVAQIDTLSIVTETVTSEDEMLEGVELEQLESAEDEVDVLMDHNSVHTANDEPSDKVDSTTTTTDQTLDLSTASNSEYHMGKIREHLPTFSTFDAFRVAHPTHGEYLNELLTRDPAQEAVFKAMLKSDRELNDHPTVDPDLQDTEMDLRSNSDPCEPPPADGQSKSVCTADQATPSKQPIKFRRILRSQNRADKSAQFDNHAYRGAIKKIKSKTSTGKRPRSDSSPPGKKQDGNSESVDNDDNDDEDDDSDDDDSGDDDDNDKDGDRNGDKDGDKNGDKSISDPEDHMLPSPTKKLFPVWLPKMPGGDAVEHRLKSFMTTPLATCKVTEAQLTHSTPLPMPEPPLSDPTALAQAIWELLQQHTQQSSQGQWSTIPEETRLQLLKALPAEPSDAPAAVDHTLVSFLDRAVETGLDHSVLAAIVGGYRLHREIQASCHEHLQAMHSILAQYRTTHGWNRSTTIAVPHHNPVSLDFGDLLSLIRDEHHEGWLTGTIVYAGLITIAEAYRQHLLTHGNLANIPIIVHPQRWSDYYARARKEKAGSKAHRSIPLPPELQDLREARDIYIPFHDEKHWSLIVISRRTSQWYHLDSKENSSRTRRALGMVARVTKSFPTTATINQYPGAGPQQTDGHSCGVFVLGHAYSLLFEGCVLQSAVSSFHRHFFMSWIWKAIDHTKQEPYRKARPDECSITGSTGRTTSIKPS